MVVRGDPGIVLSWVDGPGKICGRFFFFEYMYCWLGGRTRLLSPQANGHLQWLVDGLRVCLLP